MTVKSLINVGLVPNDGTGDQPRTIFQKINGAIGGYFSPINYGAVGDGVADDTTALQTALNAAIAAGGALVLPPGTYRSGLLTDTTTTRTMIVGQPGAVIAPSGGTWLKVAPASAKTGVVLRDLVFSIANGVAMTPITWLQGSGAGGIIDVDISNLDFGNLNNQTCDLLWLLATFNGKVSRIWGTNASGCRGIVYGADSLNSGNIHFDTVAVASAAVGIQLGRAVAGANQNLLNQVTLTNYKGVRSGASTGMRNPVTLTAGASANATALTVSSGDATAVANAITAGTPQWAVCADNTPTTGDVIKVTSASGTTINLAAPIPQALANGTIVPIGTFGFVILANTRGTVIVNPQCESVGFGVCLSTAQQTTIIGASAPATGGGTNACSYLYCTNGTQDTIDMQPNFSLAATSLTLLDIPNQGSNVRNQVIEPTGYSSGAGPTLLNNPGGTANQVVRIASGQAIKNLTYGATVTPDASYDINRIVVTDGNAFTIATPTNRRNGGFITFDIFNNSGGSMGTITWGALHTAGAFSNPATGNHRYITFQDNRGLGNGNFIEVSRATADVAD